MSKSSKPLSSLLEARDEEELMIQTLLTRKRTKAIADELTSENSSNETSGESSKRLDTGTEFKRADLIFGSPMSQVWNKAASLHSNYASFDIKNKAKTFLGLNSIINLSYEYVDWAKIDNEVWKSFVSDNDFPPVSYAEYTHAKQLSTKIKNHADPEETMQTKSAVTLWNECLHFTWKTAEENQALRIYMHFLSIFAFQRDSMDSWRLLSENDIFRIFFSPIFEIVFEGSIVKLRSGETQNTASKEVQKMMKEGDSVNRRGPYKVDLRLVLIDGDKDHDVANCEFAKDGNLERKLIIDNVKLAAEAKCIIDHIVLTTNLKAKKARCLKVVNLQACGLKMLLLCLKLDETGQGYIASPIGKTIRFPTSIAKIGHFFDTGLPLLYYLKETAEINARVLQDGLNKDSSSFGSQSPQQTQGYIKQSWFGPRPSSPKRVPKLPY